MRRQNRLALAALCVGNQVFDFPKTIDFLDAFHELVEYAVLASEMAPYDPMEQHTAKLAVCHATY